MPSSFGPAEANRPGLTERTGRGARGYPCGVQQLEVVGVRMEMPSNNPIVLLRESGGERYLPIWVGAVEATAIAYAQQGVVPPRPLTHDLMRDIITAFGVPLQAVHITELRDGVFYATLQFASGIQVSARPSDAIALALRLQAPILGTDEVLNQAGIELPDEQVEQPEDVTTGQAGEPGLSDEDVERFRAFLEDVSPEDFGDQPSG